MAQISDSIAATVTLKADGAIKDLGTLSRKAKETGASFNQASGQTTAATGKMVTGVNRAQVSASKTTSTFGQLRGQVTSASSALGTFGVAAGVVTVASAGILSAANAASRLNEQVAATNITFGSASGVVRDFSKTTATGLGIAAAEALKAANQFGAFFKQAGFAQGASAKMSTTLVQLAGDLASFKNVSVGDALGAISSGLAGESEPLRRLGVDLRQTKVDAEALALGFANTKDAITETDRVGARFVSLLRQTGDAQTDAARTAASYANTQRRLSATTEDLKANLGQALLPQLTALAQGLSLAAATATRGTAPLKEYGLQLKNLPGAIGSAILSLPTGQAPQVFLESLAAGGDKAVAGIEQAAKRYQAAIGQFGKGTPEAAAAQAALRAEVDAAEKEMIENGQATESTARATARLREESAAAAATIRSLIDAQRADQDASLRVADSRRALGDAERSLAELRAKGKVDAEKVAEAEESLADAAQGTIDARERQADAERKLSELRARGPVDAEKVATAERSLTEATRSVATARRSLAEAERELAEVRAGATQNEKGDSDREVLGAELAVERAQRRLADAQKAALIAGRQGPRAQAEASLELREAELALADAIDGVSDAQRSREELLGRGLPGSPQLADAENAVLDARHAVETATINQAKAEKDAREARAGDPDYQRNIAALTSAVAGAKRGVAGATRDEKKAGDDLRLARAGDPEFERNLADATRAVEAAVIGVRRAEEDLPLAAEAASRAQADFNGRLNDGSDAADTLRVALEKLDAQRAAAGLGGVPVGTGGGGGGQFRQRAAGGPVSAGTPYIVGENQPELFVPTVSGYIMPSVPAGSTATAATGQDVSGARGPLIPRAAGGPVSAGTPYVVGENRPELFVPDARRRGRRSLRPDIGPSLAADAAGMSSPALTQWLIGKLGRGLVTLPNGAKMFLEPGPMDLSTFTKETFEGIAQLGKGKRFGRRSRPRQAGGPVSAGVEYVVGERQAEVFVPNLAGYIMPTVPAGRSASSYEPPGTGKAGVLRPTAPEGPANVAAQRDVDGRVTPGKAYVVGLDQPEVFVTVSTASGSTEPLPPLAALRGDVGPAGQSQTTSSVASTNVTNVASSNVASNVTSLSTTTAPTARGSLASPAAPLLSRPLSTTGPRGPLLQRAAGGPVSAGTPYMVGERQPELFVPNQSNFTVPSVPTGRPASGATQSSTSNTTTNYHFDAPLPASLVQQIEYAGRLNDWRTAASGRR